MNAANIPLARELRTLSPQVTPATITATTALVAPLHAGRGATDERITRDLRYGPAERNRLDIFEPGKRGAAPLPVLVFVHGGGFVMGDKTAPGSPMYDNVGLWAVRNGFIGVNMTYRLAPEAQWPAGSDDVSATVSWVRENIGAHGGDPTKIFVMGQSAGAVHVAGYIARLRGTPPAGALLISGLYDTDTMSRDERFHAYFGSDEAKLEHTSFLRELAGTDVPLFVVVAELDPYDFQNQFVTLLEARVRRRLPPPRFVQLEGHNHFTTVWCMNTSADTLGPEIRKFVFEPR
ncbi:MAG TPA: alpha/beta hydrolase [Steroidobacteraceae bacterium]|nr:alpha/beta hydrolase [Steroidobacteraceae bacterium]